MKVFEFAKEIGIETLALMDKIRSWQLPVKSHMADLDEQMLSEIKGRLAAEREASASAPKTKRIVKKAAATKEAAAEPNAAAPAKPTTVKKAAAPKKAAAVAEAPAKAQPKAAAIKKVAPKGAVIRRKADEKSAMAEAAKAAEEARNLPVDVRLEQAAIAAAAQAEKDGVPLEVVDAIPGVTPTGPAPIVRKNIVGRMDLRRVQSPPRPGAPRTGGDAGGGGAASQDPNSIAAQQLRQKATGPRNLRTGFVAQGPVAVEPESEDDKKGVKKKTPGEQGLGAKFTATEFRKREVVFQPKKKKLMGRGDQKKTQITTPKAIKRIIKFDGTIKLGELANQMGVKAPVLVKKLMGEGITASMMTDLDFDTVALLVPEYGFEAQNTHRTEDELIKATTTNENEADNILRFPIITVMGHVDHGKTSLLDAIRKADVVSGEAGGITQHIGAYQVTLESGHTATFIDTPGHEAFTAMRARGANVTDIAVIVVAADDGVMPQTEEAIAHAKAAGVPLIIAVNKIDKPGANTEKIKQKLTEFQLVPEEWGGDTIFCEVSALKKTGIKELLEQIHLLAEVSELKANPKRSGTGTVIEAKVVKGRGSVATVLVQDGTVSKGDYFVAGQVIGRVRLMINDRGEEVQVAGPSTPIEISGLESTPMAGDRFDICKDETDAQAIADSRKIAIVSETTEQKKLSLEDIFSKVKAGEVKELGLVLKTDVSGSNEAIKGMIAKLKTEEVAVKIIHSAVGGINESDILLAGTSKGLVIGFNVRPDGAATRLAKEKGVEIKTYDIVYNLVDDLKKAMGGLLQPQVVQEDLGRAEVREVFVVPKIGAIAGCTVVDGKIQRSAMLRLVREGRIVYTGKISSLKRFKDDAREVASGFECGIGIENFNDVKVGDVIEAFHEKQILREL